MRRSSHSSKSLNVLKFFRLIFRNAGRNRLRTGLTVLAVIILVSIFVVQTTITAKVREMVQSQAGQTKLLVTERWVVPSAFPVRYLPEMTEIDGVTDWAAWNLYLCYFDEKMTNQSMTIAIATDPERLKTMTRDLENIDPALVEALKNDRIGALVGSNIMKNMNWTVGQKFTSCSTRYPGQNIEFRIVGILPEGVWSPNFFFRLDYFQEATKQKETFSYVWLRVPDTETGNRVAEEVERKFRHRRPTVKVETESAGIARFARRTEIVFAIIDMVVTVLLINMIVVLSNSITITIRERRSEMAVLKVLGFEPRYILAMIIGEAVLVGGLAGATGAFLAFSFNALAATGLLSSKLAGVANIFPIEIVQVGRGFLLGALVGFCGSALPAFAACRVRVTELFAKIA